jgi:hypothetical protein
MSLSILENRITELENQEQIGKTLNNDVNNDLQETIITEYDLPRTGLLDWNYFTCAFTVWGHYFVKILTISLFFKYKFNYLQCNKFMFIFTYYWIIREFPIN